MADTLKRTPLFELHRELGAKFTPFAGYEMPVQYPMGVLKEHLWTRENAGLFDVSHMGQAWLKTREAEIGTDAAHVAASSAIESLVPGEIRKLKKGGLRYSVLLNDEGGVLDDLMITRPPGDDRQGVLILVVNAATKEADYALIREKIGDRVDLDIQDGRSLLALQGPKAVDALTGLLPGAEELKFMTMRPFDWRGHDLIVSRCGYTGEDGFEISIPAEGADAFARALLEDDRVRPIGLGARDSLRLEAGLCLYGHDMTPATSPVEANIAFAIGKRRREEGGFPGAEKILAELKEGPKRLRVGILPEGRAPAREGAEIHSLKGEKIGLVTSGGFGPTAGRPVAMGYVASEYAATGTDVLLIVRGKALPAKVADMPFAPHRYYRG